MNIGALKEIFQPHIENMIGFNFTIDNPIFWISLLFLWLALNRFWDTKKSFSFSISLGVVLLAATKIESSIAGTMVKAGEDFDPIMIRLLAGVVICLVVLYYVFIKSDSNF
jgi:hypothetical protein